MATPNWVPVDAINLKLRDPSVNDMEKNCDRDAIGVVRYTLHWKTERRRGRRGVAARRREPQCPRISNAFCNHLSILQLRSYLIPSVERLRD